MTRENKNSCTHQNKAYERCGLTLTCIPPIHITHWICKDCGHKGEDRYQENPSDYFEYEQTVNRFKQQ